MRSDMSSSEHSPQLDFAPRGSTSDERCDSVAARCDSAAGDVVPAIAKPGAPAIQLDGRQLSTATRNIRIMHLLERLARRFNEADVPLMALKGAALNLLLYDRPEERPMSDLDLMAPVQWIARAQMILESGGCRRGAPLVREDFFPRYYYETEYVFGEIFPTRIDLHARPLRPPRYARLMPADALWDGAKKASIGKATVLVPNDTDMLIHLAAHAAVHGCAHGKWLEDIRRWIADRGEAINWERFLLNVARWRLALPVRTTLDLVRHGAAIPPHVFDGLGKMSVNWRDRLALRHAPRDAEHSFAHVAVNAICTPGAGFVLGYLWATAFPSRAHMGEWYRGRHWGWLCCAHAARLLRPAALGIVNAFKRIVGKRRAAHNGHSITKLAEHVAHRRGQ